MNVEAFCSALSMTEKSPPSEDSNTSPNGVIENVPWLPGLRLATNILLSEFLVDLAIEHHPFGLSVDEAFGLIFADVHHLCHGH